MSPQASTLALDPIVADLRQRRWDRKWDLATVVLMTGGVFTVATLARWENGVRVPSVAQARAWAGAFDCDLPQPVRKQVAA